MSVQPAERKEVQHLGIHYLDVPRIEKYFSQETNQNLQDLIARVVDFYNCSLGKSGRKYEEITLTNLNWKAQTFVPFQIRIYSQVVEAVSRLSKWLRGAGASNVSTARTVHHVFFLYREEEIFALTTGQAFHVIQKFSDYRFPTNIARRLMDPDVHQTKKRPIVGSILIMTELMKQNVPVSPSDVIDKLILKIQLKFRQDSSIYTIPCFCNKKGNPPRGGVSAEFGPGLVRISKDLEIDDYPAILNHFSRIARGKKTVCFGEDNRKETDSEDLDFLDHFQLADFRLVSRLGKALITTIRDHIYDGKNLPQYNFCHKRYSDFFNTTDCWLMADKKKETWGCPPPIQDVMAFIKKHAPEEKEKFSDWLKKVQCSFKRSSKRISAPLIDYIEGELRIQTGDVYWRLHGTWYVVYADYLGIVHEEFRKILKDHILSSDMLPEKWPSLKTREKKKQELGIKKYNAEAEFNRKFLNYQQCFVGDTICPSGVELGDIFYFDEKEVFIFHVKEGFDQHVRDVSSQILNAARLLYYHGEKINSPIKVLEAFYDLAQQKGKRVRRQLKQWTKDQFVKLFSKKLVFVYAFADKSKRERLLSKEITINSKITFKDIAASRPELRGIGKKVLKALMQTGYLSRRGRLTSKFIQSSKEKFEFPFLTLKSHRDCVYDLLKKAQSQFDSTIAKIELIHLKSELEKLGFEFRILQIQREDYSSEEGVPLCEPLLELPELSEKERAEIRKDIGEGDSFTACNLPWNIVQTEGDGACALHALLGKKVEGKYFCEAAREEFVKCLKRELSRVFGLWKKWMVDFLKDYIADPSSVYGKKVFGDVEELKKGLDQQNQSRQIVQSNKKTLYKKICRSPECQNALKGVIEVPIQNLMSDLTLMSNTFDNNLNNVLLALNKIDLGQRLSNNQQWLGEVEEECQHLYETFINRPEMFDAYIKGVSDKSYYFSTQELEIAAYLFGKYVIVYDHLFGDQVRLAGAYGDPSKEFIVMFHKGLHFSRCEWDEEEVIEKVIKKRKQEE